MSDDPTSAILQRLAACRRVLVVTHSRPDGDALGSAAAMALALGRKSIEAQILLFEPPPEKYSFVLTENRLPWFHIAKGWSGTLKISDFDAMLVVDTGTWSQLPGLKEILAGYCGAKLVVDHHMTQEDWADIKLVDTRAAAAAEIVAGLSRAWGLTIDAQIALPLFWGIATDTGWFQYSNTTPKTMRLAADLMETGIDTERVYRLSYQNERPQRLALMGRAMQSLELLAGDRLAVMSVGQADFTAMAAQGSDTENFVNIPMQVSNVEVSVFLSEPDAGPIRVSLRAKGKVDVAAFAAKFAPGAGGGHARAAGLKVKGTLLEVRRAIAAALVAELSNSAIL